MNSVLEQISAIGIVPVIKIDKLENAIPLAKALCEGGLPCAEITFRTAQAEEAIRLISNALPHMLVGAGTVLTTQQADAAVAAGASFVVSPGLNPKVVAHCIAKNIPIVPGVSTASDIEAALELGLDSVKFFPAEACGGIKAIKALAAPYVNVKFLPTGGVTAKNLNDYLSFDRVLACGGSWMVDTALVSAGNFDAIKALTREAVNTMLGFELAHVGINAANEEEANSTARLFCTLLGVEYKPGNSSIFAGSMIEVMKQPYLGRLGHIAIATNSLARGVHYLESQGYIFNPDSKKTDAKGKPTAIYLMEEFGGFAVHLVQKK